MTTALGITFTTATPTTNDQAPGMPDIQRQIFFITIKKIKIFKKITKHKTNLNFIDRLIIKRKIFTILIFFNSRHVKVCHWRQKSLTTHVSSLLTKLFKIRYTIRSFKRGEN